LKYFFITSLIIPHKFQTLSQKSQKILLFTNLCRLYLTNHVNRNARRWDEKYQKRRYDTYLKTRKFLIDHSNYLPCHGMALDVQWG
jgi:hypothetical protein